MNPAVTSNARPIGLQLRRLVVLLLSCLLPPLVAGGVTLAVRLQGAGESLATTSDLSLPARPPSSARPLAVIVAGNHGTEITDALPLVELLGASGAFEVRIVAPERRPSPFATHDGRDAGLDFIPDLSFDDYAALVGREPQLLIVPYLQRWRAEDAAVVPWLRAHTGPHTLLLSICQGAALVAASGLFDAHAATANDRRLPELIRRYPAVRWQSDVRWVRDGQRMSSALLAAGLDATLAAIDGLAGSAAAARAVEATGYPGFDAFSRRAQPHSRIPIGLVLDAAYRWRLERVGIVLGDGVSESAVAGLIDAYAATYRARTVSLGQTRREVYTRHGVRLVARAPADAAPALQHVVAAGSGPGYGYDLARAEIARHHGRSTARIAAEVLDYPAEDQELPEGLPLGLEGACRALLLALVGAASLWLRRLRRSRVMPARALRLSAEARAGACSTGGTS